MRGWILSNRWWSVGANVHWLIVPAGALGLALAFRGKGMTNNNSGVELRYFQPSEFGDWWPYMSADLLRKLDEFRHRWGEPVMISPANGGLGRHLGEGGQSQHNIDAWGKVRAVDVFPRVGRGYIKKANDRRRAYEIANAVGFTGIGLYTDTQPGNMVHLDVRPGGYVATWSRVEGEYLGLDTVV